ncbi:MAG: sugar ABC transporter permease [Spirochaetaceae bacterium 4572_7]|nr:MAG: sugar ABC transporter permease [Spirochaetaceae bacterium 4572_7]
MLNENKIINIERTVSYIILAFLVFISLFPFVILIINSSRLHTEITKGFSIVPGTYFFTNWNNLFSDRNIPILSALGNSIFISAFTSLFSVYFSAMTAYAIFMYNFKGKEFAFRFIMLVMMVPPQVSALGFIRLVIKLNLMNSFIPLIIPAIASPVIFFFILQYMKSSLPTEIVEAARIDGSGEIRTFNTIVFPILKPAIAVQAIFSFVGSWNNYFMPALIIDSKFKKTIPILIAQLRSADYMKFDLGKVYMLIFIAIIPLMIVYLFLSRYIIKGITMGSVKG